MPNESKQNPHEHENNGINPVARRNARRYAVQAMYQWQIAGASLNDIEAEFMQRHIDKQIDMAYFKELIHGVPELQKTLDKEMQPYLGRLLQEIDPIELAVLRIAVYEILKRPDVPWRVIINEALELTKRFGSVEGYKFVNGVLDRVAKKNRATEISMGKEIK